MLLRERERERERRERKRERGGLMKAAFSDKQEQGLV